MSKMLFKPGKAKTWKGVGYDWKIVSEDQISEHLDAGWLSHPDDLLKRGRKPKAVADESDDEE
ncbi:hypothetical protein CJP72_06250 [Citrobacter sp. NCU1]|uniref:hypothetical protein n=1 Tax=Citrobacter sp. NCU1 TaxID=2026683 RepID=UPI0013912ECA|nr:hypothetical protein [Citrobacter sp. NCU1]NDO80391.1 hypothetical protein [Citrobacter sp. NCU1]